MRSFWVGVGPFPGTGVLTRDDSQRHTHTGEGHGTKEVETGVMCLEAKAHWPHQQWEEAGQRPPRKHGPAATWIWDVSPLEAWEKKSLVLSSPLPPGSGRLSQHPQNTNSLSSGLPPPLALHSLRTSEEKVRSPRCGGRWPHL